MPIKDECGLCRRVFPVRFLRRCVRCGRLYCRDCVVADVSTGDPMRMMCLNCAKRTVAPRIVGKYDGLTGYLRFRGSFTNLVKLSLARVDGIIRDNLPMAAYKSEAWWSNLLGNTHSRAWLNAGWKVREVDLKEGFVVFEKVKNVPLKSRRREVVKPFVPAPVHVLRKKQPSKTRVSRLYARIKNVERQRLIGQSYRGSFRPKRKYEKRLFKPDRKPQ